MEGEGEVGSGKREVSISEGSLRSQQVFAGQ